MKKKFLRAHFAKGWLVGYFVALGIAIYFQHWPDWVWFVCFCFVMTMGLLSTWPTSDPGRMILRPCTRRSFPGFAGLRPSL
jgi:hypothetical protein